MDTMKGAVGGTIFAVGVFCWTIMSHFQWDRELDREQKRKFWFGVGAMALLPIRVLVYNARQRLCA